MLFKQAGRGGHHDDATPDTDPNPRENHLKQIIPNSKNSTPLQFAPN